MGLPGEGGGRGHPAGRRLGLRRERQGTWLSLFSKQMPFFPPQVEKEGKNKCGSAAGSVSARSHASECLGVHGEARGAQTPQPEGS